jgi:signal transduction histidine kinase
MTVDVQQLIDAIKRMQAVGTRVETITVPRKLYDEIRTAWYDITSTPHYQDMPVTLCGVRILYYV